MLNAPESLKTATAQAMPVSEPVTEGQGKSDNPTKIICDLAEANAFCESYGKPHVPIMSTFGAGRLHVCRLPGSYDLDRAAAENPDILFRSIRNLPFKHAKDTSKEWDDVTFQFGPRAFVYADKNRVIGFGATPMEAERLVTQFSKTYLKTPAPAGGDFHLIQQDGSSINCHTVSLPPETILSDETLSLHYGGSSAEWHRDFVGKLQERINGLSIFEGSPGTGKTFYLRHLMGVLKESHRLYFIPTSFMGVLSKPEFIGFWADQHRMHANRKFVVILEDSDAALMTRGSDNREQVSAILNLSDGMLADFLRLQIICTIKRKLSRTQSRRLMRLIRPNIWVESRRWRLCRVTSPASISASSTISKPHSEEAEPDAETSIVPSILHGGVRLCPSSVALRRVDRTLTLSRKVRKAVAK